MADTEIILNDCFKTKKAKVTNITHAFKDAYSQTNIPDKEVLTFNIDDLCILQKYEGSYYKDIANYNNELYPDPSDIHYKDAANSEPWAPHTTTKTALSESAYAEDSTKISNYTGTDFPELKNITGYHIACMPTKIEGDNISWNGYDAKYFSKAYSDEYIKSLYSAEIIEASFTIAIPFVTVTRYTIFDPSSKWYRPEDVFKNNVLDYTTYPASLLKNNPTLSQRNHITIGATLPNSDFRARFVLFFDNITKNPYSYIQEEDYNYEPGVYLVIGKPGFIPAANNNFTNTTRYKIPNWDGNSLRTFKFYTKKINGIIKGTLKVIDISGEEILITDDINVSSVIADDQSTSQFGQYATMHISNFIIKDLSYKIKPTEQYDFLLQNKNGTNVFSSDSVSSGSKKLIDFYINEYRYNISSNSGDVYWFNGMHTQLDNSLISLTEDLFDEKLHNPYFLFQKKDKQIKVITDSNSITEFSNPNKQIYSINVSELKALTSLNLSGNELKSIDLSNNINLRNIDLSNNIKLNTIIWPKGYFTNFDNTTNSDYIINIANTNINNIQFISIPSNPSNLNCRLNLILRNNDKTLDKVTKIDIQGILIQNPDDCDLVNAIFPNIKEVNISETNILSSKARLEKFLNNLPDRSNKEPGVIYLYGKKYTHNGVQGCASAIKDTLENLKNKNWLFYL